uniref:Large ribosomal subunit protein uL2c n=1 Tax=Cibotium barometz TaxID=29588 RepID=A0A2S1PV93_CIBBA|nr:ribosomal protein L2 [Cibotium barometz]YP_010878764.1 ribosomal protein L2 [Cibotium cumingii]WHE38219.1 ribosomal protein L2 [Cibotium sinoburmaense]AWH62744.1 ribosomal protein L2 [Cibotium barometz]WHE37957.1 ribosomal protein L2 [Cibotium barometz]WHE38044.1 ribosomal protein L2 [Cibotium barometz]WHE38132.1 ribosomal protein L2 [Cibotium barometz]
MAIRLYKAYTPGTRNRAILRFGEATKSEPQKQLTYRKISRNGRNNRGIVTSRHRGGGHKRLYRRIDFRRDKVSIIGRVASIEYDPNRNAYICLINYIDGEKRYILHARGIGVGDVVTSGPEASVSNGNALPLIWEEISPNRFPFIMGELEGGGSTPTKIPLGTTIHNIEMKPGKGGQLVRAAGAVAKIVAKEGQLATLRLPSGEIRLISQNCLASVGRVGNVDTNNEGSGKAGSKRWLGKRPKVRGAATNPVDHPHGGGEGRTSIGRKKPLTPWGYVALGKRSRKSKKYSNPLILRRRKSH